VISLLFRDFCRQASPDSLTDGNLPQRRLFATGQDHAPCLLDCNTGRMRSSDLNSATIPSAPVSPHLQDERAAKVPTQFIRPMRRLSESSPPLEWPRCRLVAYRSPSTAGTGSDVDPLLRLHPAKSRTVVTLIRLEQSESVPHSLRLRDP
jgi:hypothetical protein